MKPIIKILNFAGIFATTTFTLATFTGLWFTDLTYTEPNKIILAFEIIVFLFFTILCNKKAWRELK